MSTNPFTDPGRTSIIVWPQGHHKQSGTILPIEDAVDEQTGETTYGWEYRPFVTGGAQRFETTALMPTQAALKLALERHTKSLYPDTNYDWGIIASGLRSRKQGQPVTGTFITERTMKPTKGETGETFQCSLEPVFEPVYLMDILVASKVGTLQERYAHRNRSFKSALTKRMLIGGASWVGSQPSKQDLSECLTGKLNKEENLDLMVSRLQRWQPTLQPDLRPEHSGRMTAFTCLGEHMLVDRGPDRSLADAAFDSVYCQVYAPMGPEEQGTSPIFGGQRGR